MTIIKYQKSRNKSKMKYSLESSSLQKLTNINTNTSNNIKGVIFDFDGVIASFDVRFGWPFFNALKKIKPTIKPSETILIILNLFKKMTEQPNLKGLKVINLLIQIGRKIGLSMFKIIQFLSLFGLYYFKNEEKIVPLLGVREVIREVQNEGYKTILVTNSRRKTIESAKIKIPELNKFDLIITSNDVKYNKPNPTGFQIALKSLGLVADEVISIGDQVSDILVGKKVGVKTIALASYYVKYLKTHLEEISPDFIITDVRDLLNVLLYIKHCNNGVKHNTINISKLVEKYQDEFISQAAICKIT